MIHHQCLSCPLLLLHLLLPNYFDSSHRRAGRYRRHLNSLGYLSREGARSLWHSWRATPTPMGTRKRPVRRWTGFSAVPASPSGNIETKRTRHLGEVARSTPSASVPRVQPSVKSPRAYRLPWRTTPSANVLAVTVWKTPVRIFQRLLQPAMQKFHRLLACVSID